MFYGDMTESIPVQVRSVKNVKRKTMYFCSQMTV